MNAEIVNYVLLITETKLKGTTPQHVKLFSTLSIQVCSYVEGGTAQNLAWNLMYRAMYI